MSSRYFDQLPSYINFTHTWGNNSGMGRWVKRRLSKARRRFGRSVCRYGEDAYRHMGSLQHWEGEANWKCW